MTQFAKKLRAILEKAGWTVADFEARLVEISKDPSAASAYAGAR